MSGTCPPIPAVVRMKSSAELATSFRLAGFHLRWTAMTANNTIAASARETMFSPFCIKGGPMSAVRAPKSRRQCQVTSDKEERRPQGNRTPQVLDCLLVTCHSPLVTVLFRRGEKNRGASSLRSPDGGECKCCHHPPGL